MPELHEHIKDGVEHHVGDEDGQEEGGKVGPSAGQRGDAVARQAPIGGVQHQQQGKPTNRHTNLTDTVALSRVSLTCPDTWA